MVNIIKVVNTNIQFNDTSISLAPIVSYTWDFGDDTTSKIMNPIHMYSSVGIYNITHSAINDCGNENIISKTIEILEQQPSKMGGIVVMVISLGLAIGIIYSKMRKKVSKE